MTLSVLRLKFVGVLLIAAALAATVTGCGGKKGTKDLGRGNFPTDSNMITDGSGAPNDSDWNATGSMQNATNGGNAPGTHSEGIGGETMAQGAPIPELLNVYFSFDSEELNDAAKAQLDKNAAYLKNSPKLHVVLRGHADERGTEEYNVALGSKRAQVVRDYLVDKGINEDRLQTVSFGESMPASTDTDDASLSLNRRVEFFVYTIE